MGEHRDRCLPQGRLAFLRHDEEGQIHDRAGRNPGWIQARAHETIGRQRVSKQALRSGTSVGVGSRRSNENGFNGSCAEWAA